MNTKELIRRMTEEFIIPNWYTPSDFGMDWDDERTEQFKEWFAKMVCNHDPFREIMEEYIENFEKEVPCDDDEDDDEDDEDEDEDDEDAPEPDNAPEPNNPPEPDYPHPEYDEDCTDDNRCEECTHCRRTRPCSCGCELLGGSCKVGYKLDTGFDLSDDDEDDGRYCFYCNIPIIHNTCCKDCNKKRIDKGLDPI